MANPPILIKRSAVPGKRPSESQLELGALALNTNDGRLFVKKENVGIGTTITLLTPWTENIGGGVYYTEGNVGINTTNPLASLDVIGNVTISGVTTSTQLYEGSFRVLTREITDATKEPTGHEDRTQSVISFDSSTRIFSISPVSGSFNIWSKAQKYNFTSTQSITLPNSTGLHYIYFNSVGILTYKDSFFNLETDIPTAYIYWNAGISSCIYFGDERHGVTLDWATHEYLHRTRGTVYASGLGISNYTLDGNGSLNSHAQFDVAGGTIFDEDIKIAISHSNAPTPNTWQQDLEGPGRIPVLYLSGTSWILDFPTDYALKQGTSRIQYNLNTGGTWSTVDCPSNKDFTCSWLIATNNLNYPVIAILGQSYSNKISDIEALNFNDLTLTGFPSLEFRPLFKLIWKTDSGYTNTPKASLIEVYDLRGNATASLLQQPVSVDHGALTGLSDDDHLQYLHTENTRTVTATHTFNNGLISLNNIGIGTTSPTVKLDVIGDARISGVITATTFSGNLNSGVGTITNLNSTTGIITNITGVAITANSITATNLSNSGVATFTNGPVLIGSATSTGTSSQRLQVTGGGYISGNLGIGSTNPTVILDVIGNVRISGILTVGSSSVTINGINNIVNVGTGVTFYGNTGIVSATSYYGDGSNLIMGINPVIAGMIF